MFEKKCSGFTRRVATAGISRSSRCWSFDKCCKVECVDPNELPNRHKPNGAEKVRSLFQAFVPTYVPYSLYPRRDRRHIPDPPRCLILPKDLAMRNTADVTSGKPIAVRLKSISGVSAINPLVAFYDICGRNREMLFYSSVPDTTRDTHAFVVRQILPNRLYWPHYVLSYPYHKNKLL
jgi:hypothetical protein